MTLYHFGNCFALAYVPYYLTYKYSGLAEYGAFWKCFQAGIIYVLTQLCKMLVLATFFPTADESSGPGSIDFLGEFWKTTTNLADLAGLYLVLSRIPGKGHAKVLTAGIGWATAELILTRFLVLWVGARGIEFDWQYIQKSLDANISLMHHTSVCALVWVWCRRESHPSLVPGALVLLTLCSYKSLVLDMAMSVGGLGSWTALAMKFLLSLLLGLFSAQIYAAAAPNLGLY